MNSESKSKSEDPIDETLEISERQAIQCTCVQDPFAVLPAELRPRQISWKNGLRKVTCPGCGLEYWTNRNTDLCVDCEKKGIKLPT